MAYPLPTINDLITKLQGADTFFIHDLNQTYLQLELDEEAEKIIVIDRLGDYFLTIGSRLDSIVPHLLFNFFKYYASTISFRASLSG